MDRISACFGRVEPRLTVRDFLLGLLAPLARKNCWWLAEHAGHRGPARMQRLLRDVVWDAETVRDQLRDLVVEHLGHPDAILIVDETGFLKKGTGSVGVQRQYSGTAGRIENCQVAVFLAYASPHGRALIDRRIYLPQSWIDDRDRCQIAGVPDDLQFATKPSLAAQMITAALAAGITVGFVTGDECYGRDPRLRAVLQEHGVGYVLAVARNQYTQITTATRERADVTESWLSAQAWQRRSAGPGSKGDRFYDWAWISIHHDTPGCHSLLIRRNRAGELAFYLCWSAHPVALSTLIRVAGTRWAVEENFQIAKGQVGLDQYQCRGWTQWHRYTVLAMLALAILVITIATTHRPSRVRISYPATEELIALTVPEIRRLINATLTRPIRPDTVLVWSAWRRRHQARAKASHYKRREAIENGQLSR
uniref:IS701 family transposase n=1 Tax=Hamadaea tsunoensis TaxID=53368 RepID=UPI0012FB5949|nr:IS701 family transposase [Hamadaea tsunoensis]